MNKRPLIGALAVFLFLASAYFILQMTVPVADVREPFELLIEDGMNYRQAATMFYDRGLIRDKQLFIALGRATGLHRRLMPGYYLISRSPSPWDIFTALRKGLVVRWEVTVVEGDTLEDIKGKLDAKKIIRPEDFDRLASDAGLLKKHAIDSPSIEGYLFPDTYRIPKGTNDEEVLGMMIKGLRNRYEGQFRERAAEMGMDERGVLTLASIIEKEAVVERERALISAVYHNRMKKGMRLQADPTAIYGIKSQKKGVTKRDIRRKTDYNTYYIDGLPPGPIASPGINSIKAALYPADAPYFYFVSNGDGTHTFSVTAEEHLRAVEEYFAKKAELRAAQ